jgi:hypothetical protein
MDTSRNKKVRAKGCVGSKKVTMYYEKSKRMILEEILCFMVAFIIKF